MLAEAFGTRRSGVTAYLPAFLVVREVAVSREPSCTELLPRVGVLIGLWKCQEQKKKHITTPSRPITV